MSWIHDAVVQALPVLLAVCLPRGSAQASGGPPPILNPYVRTSPSSAYALSVNPSDLHGRGPADYRFTKNGATVWTNGLPFTLWDCKVSDSGSVAGFAYSHGQAGLSEGGFNAGMGDFSVVLLSPTGKTLAQDTAPREFSRFPGGLPRPLAEGVVINGVDNLAVFRIADSDINRGVEAWRVYDLGTGRQIDVVEPVKRMAGQGRRLWVLAAEAVPSTPLTLVHWWKYGDGRAGGIFTLVDRTAKPVWSLELDQDYTVPGDENKRDEIRRMIQKQGGILGVMTNGTFDLLHVKAGQRVSYAVERQADGSWQACETGRVPYAWPPPPETVPAFPSATLKRLGEFSLKGVEPENKGPLRDFDAFDFDDKGRVCAARRGRDDPPCLVFLTQDGEVLGELRLPAERESGRFELSNPAHVGGSRFVVSLSDPSVGGMARWFLADFDAGTVRTVPQTNCPGVKAVAGFPDGSFVALTLRNQRHTMTHGLFRFDAAGKLLWSREQGGYGGGTDELLSPEDVTRYGTNRFAVLDNIRNTIQLFDLDGKLDRLIDLEKAWGREPNYPTDLAEDEGAGFIVYDFNAPQALLRLTENGAIRSAAEPKLADGSLFRVYDGVKRSPQGDLWTCNGDSLFRLSANAAVDRVVGHQPTPDVLAEPGCTAVGPDGRVYVADAKSKTVHVFDAQGKRVGRCAPKPTELSECSSVEHIALSPEGKVFVSMGVCSQAYLQFSGEFRRQGWVTNTVDSISQEWYFQPSNNLCWIAGYRHVFLVKGTREVVRRISRRADGRWLEYPDSAGVAPDGSLALASRAQSGEIAISLYSPGGDPVATFATPFKGYIGRLAFNGRHVFALHDKGVLIFNADGTVVGKADLPSLSPEADWSGPFVAAGGREVWLVELRTLKVFRFAAP